MFDCVTALSQTGAPLEILKQLESTEVPETYSGEFECVVSREDADGSWFFGDKLLSSSSKHVISSRRGRHTLSVKEVKKEDQGKYTFKVGDFKTSASLKMKREIVFLVIHRLQRSRCGPGSSPSPLVSLFWLFNVDFVFVVTFQCVQ